MTEPSLPNLAVVLVDRYLLISDITALTSTRIGTAIGDDWFSGDVSRHAILIDGPNGSPGDDYMVRIMRTRYDFKFYGSTFAEAMHLWSVAHPYICPRENVAFITAGVRVRNVVKEGGPSKLPDPVKKWAAILATYVYSWDERLA